MAWVRKLPRICHAERITGKREAEISKVQQAQFPSLHWRLNTPQALAPPADTAFFDEDSALTGVHTCLEGCNRFPTRSGQNWGRFGSPALQPWVRSIPPVPVCFAYDGKVFYSAVDLKPKRVAPERLARLQHFRASSRVALLIDHYDEDWSRLWYILVRGKAKVIPNSAYKKRVEAIRQLKAKYPQYAAGMLPDDAPIIRITPERITSWGQLSGSTNLVA
jgi:PPOX class probable F420-dependent enzyme